MEQKPQKAAMMRIKQSLKYCCLKTQREEEEVVESRLIKGSKACLVGKNMSPPFNAFTHSAIFNQ